MEEKTKMGKKEERENNLKASQKLSLGKTNRLVMERDNVQPIRTWHMATKRVMPSRHLKCDRNRISEVTFEVGQPFVFLSSSRWLMWTME